MTTPDATAAPAAASPSSPSVFVDPGRGRLRTSTRGVLFLFSLAVLLGGIFGIIWNTVVKLPVYVVDDNLGASTTERGLTEYVAIDAWFVILAAVGGLVLGWLSWIWFKGRGWRCVLIALAAAMIGALMCWGVGTAFGPHNFSERIAAAAPGDSVEIDFVLQSMTALLVWPFLAIIPVLIGSSFGAEPENNPSPPLSRLLVDPLAEVPRAAPLPTAKVTTESGTGEREARGSL